MYPMQNPEASVPSAARDVWPTWPDHARIGRAALLTSCLPAVDSLRSHRILELISAGDDGVFIQYEYELMNGERHRNTEFVTVRDGQPVETQLFFGGLI